MIQKEAEESLGQSEWLRRAYKEFIENKSEVEVDEVKFQGEKLATAAVNVNTYSLKMRKTLLDIASRVDSTKTSRFNFGGAASLINKQTGETKRSCLSAIRGLPVFQGYQWMDSAPLMEIKGIQSFKNCH